MGFDYLAILADDLLDAAQTGLGEQARPEPSISRVAHAIPSWDTCCPDDETGEGGGLLTVYLEQIDYQPSDVAPRCAVVGTATFAIELARCVPSLIDSPTQPFHSGEVYGAAAIALLEDLWAISREVFDRWQAGSLFPESGVDCAAVTLGQAVPLEEQGGCAGWRWSISVVLNDTGAVGS